eukprot:1158771-Pelagomonas_calceolata.AAC.8
MPDSLPVCPSPSDAPLRRRGEPKTRLEWPRWPPAASWSGAALERYSKLHEGSTDGRVLKDVGRRSRGRSAGRRGRGPD